MGAARCAALGATTSLQGIAPPGWVRTAARPCSTSTASKVLYPPSAVSRATPAPCRLCALKTVEKWLTRRIREQQVSSWKGAALQEQGDESDRAWTLYFVVSKLH